MNFTLEIRGISQKKYGGYLQKLLISQLLSTTEYQTWYQIIDNTQHFHQIARYANDLFSIFTYTNENMRNTIKIAEKLSGCTYKITHISVADCHSV